MLASRSHLVRLGSQALAKSSSRAFHQVAATSTTALSPRLSRSQNKQVAIHLGGRSSVSGLTATVFGASGFLGRYVVNNLGRIGSQVIVPYRGDGMNVRHLRVMGDLGQIVALPFSVRDRDSVAKAVEGSNVVINLIGLENETRNFNYELVHQHVAERIAEVSAECGVDRLVHVSALGAHDDAASRWFRSKAEGEKAVRKAFPEATIVRPATMFGVDDRFINKIGSLLNWSPYAMPIIDHGEQLLQPVYVHDVADAIVKILTVSDSVGRDYDLAGPNIMTMRDIVEFSLQEMGKPHRTLNYPTFVARLYGRIFDLLPEKYRAFNEDEIIRMMDDIVLDPKSHAGRFKDLDIQPMQLSRLIRRIILPHNTFTTLPS